MDKLALINSMLVIESSACGGELEWVYVENTEENRNKLQQLGVKEFDINDMTSDEGDVIDISGFGFAYAGAKWFEPDAGGFIDFVPEHAPEWAK
jgi:hypothetical protein